MRIISKEDYCYLVTNGCPCEGDYVDGLGIAGSDTVQVRSSHPRYPNEKAYAILRDTTFFHTVRLPTITPIVSPSAPAYVHENLMEMLKKVAEPGLTPAAREMANLLLKKCQERKDVQKKKKEEKIRKKEEIKRRAAEKNKPVNLKEINDIDAQIQKLSDKIKEYEQVEYEIGVLATSNQTYHVIIGQVQNSKQDVHYYGYSIFNDKNGIFEIHLRTKKDVITFAHELKHAYQFEMGKLSSPSLISRDKNTGRINEYTFGMYDKEDELEAFARGQLFGGQGYDNRVYEFLPERKDIEQHAIRDTATVSINKAGYALDYRIMNADYIAECERKLKDPLTPMEDKRKICEELQRFANAYGTSFRCNGVTYRPENNRR